jgi:hypothetical protein
MSKTPATNAKVNTVNTSTNNNTILPDLGNLSLEARAELFAMLQRDTAVVTQAKSANEAELNRLNAEKARIEAAISPLNKELGEILTQIRALSGRVASPLGQRTRTTNVCVECGQGRHADNDKTRGCVTYKTAIAAKAAEKTNHSPAIQ